MKLIPITPHNENIFFNCLQTPGTVPPELMAIRRHWYQNFIPKGLRAKLLLKDNGQAIGLCQYIPVEHSPLAGERLLTILCIAVHGDTHHIGNQQGQGGGRLMLEAIEADARASGAQGVAAWGMNWDINWIPVQCFEHFGYQRSELRGKR